MAPEYVRLSASLTAKGQGISCDMCSTTVYITCLERPPLLVIKYGLQHCPRQVVFCDKLNCVQIWALLLGISGPSRQVVSHSSSLSKEISLYYAGSYNVTRTCNHGYIIQDILVLYMHLVTPAL